MSEKVDDKKHFKYIDAEEFLDTVNEDRLSIDSEVVAFSEKERELIHLVSKQMQESEPEVLDYIGRHILLGNQFAKNVSQFPSILHKMRLSSEIQTRQSILDLLLSKDIEGDKTLFLPGRASVGRVFIISKFNAFFTLYKITRNRNFPPEIVKKAHSVCLNLMFALMTEDVYLTLLDDSSININIRQEIAEALLILWEYRSDQNIEAIAPVLNNVWKARRKFAPAFGTMLGTSELLLLSIEMDDQWRHFIATKLGDSDVSSSLEEFLFGISYEKIQRIKNYIRERGISAVNRHEAELILGENIPNLDDVDLRHFYRLYSLRRDDAATRRRMGLQGPHRTLEAHYMKFILESNMEKQANDTFAK